MELDYLAQPVRATWLLVAVANNYNSMGWFYFEPDGFKKKIRMARDNGK